MGLIIGVVRESSPVETRVPLVPEIHANYVDLGATLVAEHDVGTGLSLADSAFETVRFGDRQTVLQQTDVVLCIGRPALDVPSSMRAGADLIHAVKALLASICR